jgi:hypothetical protein
MRRRSARGSNARGRGGIECKEEGEAEWTGLAAWSGLVATFAVQLQDERLSQVCNLAFSSSSVMLGSWHVAADGEMADGRDQGEHVQ